MTYVDILGKLKEMVTEESGVTIEEIEGDCREKEVAAVRHLYCYYAIKYGFSSITTGKSINRDHATALASAKKARYMLESGSVDSLVIRGYARKLSERKKQFEKEIS